MDPIEQGDDARPDPGQDLASRVLGRPFSVAVGLLCAVQVALWAPSYLSWPFWADLDVFATAARAWDAGILPYRDLSGNNFPGTTYAFWALGKVFGWGKTPPFLALDVALVVALGLLLGRWSLKGFGTRLPGLIGFSAFLGYYLDLDYTQVAQRDWQGPFFAVASILILQTWNGRLSVLASGLAMASAIAIRPQSVLFGPGVVVALLDRSRDASGRIIAGPAARLLLLWTASAAAGLALAALPLIRAGIFDDFVRLLRLVGPGSRYNKLSRKQVIDELMAQVVPFRVLAVPTALLILGLRRKAGADPAPAWLATFPAVLLYRPLSPQIHAYLFHPIQVDWSILVAALAGRIWSSRAFGPTGKLVALVLLMGLGTATKPRFCSPVGSRVALGILAKGTVPNIAPTGYEKHPKVPLSAWYKWADYRDLLRYLKTLPPEIRVANALKGVPAVNGPSGRLPVFPAESLAWLYMVRPEDEPKFVEALDNSPESVVVWAPSEREAPGLIRLEALTAAIERLYEPDRKFGTIEVWRRKPRPKDRP